METTEKSESSVWINSKNSTSTLCDSKTTKKEEEVEKCAAPRPTICQTFPTSN